MKSFLRLLALFVVVLAVLLAIALLPGTHIDGKLTGFGYSLTTLFGLTMITLVKPRRTKNRDAARLLVKKTPRATENKPGNSPDFDADASMSHNRYASSSSSPENCLKPLRNVELKSARTLLIIVGVIQFLFGVWHVSQTRAQFDEAVDAEVRKQGAGFVVDRDLADLEFEKQKVVRYSLQGIPIALACFFFIMAGLVFKFPVGATLASLIVYVLFLIGDLLLDPSGIAQGIIPKIIFVALFWKAYRSASHLPAAGPPVPARADCKTSPRNAFAPCQRPLNPPEIPHPKWCTLK
jgi:hypothetical protein